MRSRLIVFLPSLLLALMTPAPASATATIAVDRGCYADASQRADTVRLTGSGFTPDAPYQMTLDGQPPPGGTGTTDALGNLAGSLASPQLAEGVREKVYELEVREGANAPKTSFTVSRLAAFVWPLTGDPKTLKVRFGLFGFGLSGLTPPPIYVHYVRPGGQHLKTFRLGTGRGACGSIARTARRRLLPFVVRRGSWRLQFDTARTYRRGTSTSTFLFFTVTVRVQRG